MRQGSFSTLRSPISWARTDSSCTPPLRPGGVSIFPINSNGSLGTPSTVKVGNNPVGIVVSRPPAGGTAVFAYVIDQETPTTPSAQVLGFSQNLTTGALTPTPGTTITTDTATGKTVAVGYRAGTTPSAV